MSKKTCTKCNVEQPVINFQTYKVKGQTKIRSQCAQCRNESQKERYRTNPDVHREYLLKRKYNLSLEDYDKLIEQQDGKCAICNTENPGGHHKRFVVDHNHKTGEVRALLCSTCNTGLGNFYDNPQILLKAAEYLFTNGHYGKTSKGD